MLNFDLILCQAQTLEYVIKKNHCSWKVRKECWKVYSNASHLARLLLRWTPSKTIAEIFREEYGRTFTRPIPKRRKMRAAPRKPLPANYLRIERRIKDPSVARRREINRSQVCHETVREIHRSRLIFTVAEVFSIVAVRRDAAARLDAVS